MAEPVDWRADGVARSARFGDIYHSESGAHAQARHVFLGGCGLPQAWAGQPQWRILETGFGLGLNFLTTWLAWRSDPRRPRMLHFASIEAHPVSRDDVLRAAAAHPALAPLGTELAAQWWGLLPGFHRFEFDAGRVLLTLGIGDVQPMLRAQQFEADSIFLDGFSPTLNPRMWSPETLKAVSRLARRGTGIATWSVARPVRDALAQCGFQLRKVPGLPPKRDCLQGVFDPAWQIRRRHVLPDERVYGPDGSAAPGHCAVIGAGLAGAAVAASLARRGWRVTVLDGAATPAAGASGLPAGVLAPHVSPDDALLSRLTRAGVRAAWLQAEALLRAGIDWDATGVLERRAPGALRLPAGWTAEGPNASWRAGAAQLRKAGLPEEADALWHARAGWVRPARLVSAWLAQPGIRLEPGRRIARVTAAGGGWRLHGTDGTVVVDADRVVIAAGHDSAAFAPALPLQPVRGQIAWGRITPGLRLPAMTINGDGHLISQVPDGGDMLWLAGATFDRDHHDTTLRAADTEANRARLARLHPTAAAVLAPAFMQGTVQGWAGVRCASADRRPLVGPLDASNPSSPWLSTAMGSRGLSFATLCAELLAARWHGEPLPLPVRLAQALDTRRRLPSPPGSSAT